MNPTTITTSPPYTPSPMMVSTPTTTVSPTNTIAAPYHNHNVQQQRGQHQNHSNINTIMTSTGISSSSNNNNNNNNNNNSPPLLFPHQLSPARPPNPSSSSHHHHNTNNIYDSPPYSHGSSPALSLPPSPALGASAARGTPLRSPMTTTTTMNNIASSAAMTLFPSQNQHQPQQNQQQQQHVVYTSAVNSNTSSGTTSRHVTPPMTALLLHGGSGGGGVHVGGTGRGYSAVPPVTSNSSAASAAAAVVGSDPNYRHNSGSLAFVSGGAAVVSSGSGGGIGADGFASRLAMIASRGRREEEADGGDSETVRKRSAARRNIFSFFGNMISQSVRQGVNAALRRLATDNNDNGSGNNNKIEDSDFDFNDSDLDDEMNTNTNNTFIEKGGEPLFPRGAGAPANTSSSPLSPSTIGGATAAVGSPLLPLSSPLRRKAYYKSEYLESSRIKTATLWKDLFHLAAPTAMMIMIGFATQGITVAFIGQRIGSDAIGMFSIGNSVFNLFGISIGFGLTAALDTLVSQSFGRHKQDSAEIGEYIQRATLINLLLAVPIACVFIFGEPIFALMFGHEIARGVVSYTQHAVPYMVLYLVAETFIKVLQAIDEPNLPFFATLASAVACWFFNYFFMYGDFVAAAWVMTATYVVQVVCLAGICFLHPRITFWKRCKWFDKNVLFDRKGMKEYLDIGIPALAACIAEWWAFEVVQIIAAGISIRQVAALNITMNVSGLIFSLSLGVCTAASVKVGNAMGENKPQLAKRYAQTAIYFDQAMNCATCTALLLFRGWIGPLFTTESDMVDEFSFLAVILAVYHWGDSTQIAIQGVFRGVGKQGEAVAPVLFALWAVGLPCCYVFGRQLAMDAGGIMLGLIVGFGVEIPLLLRKMNGWNWRAMANEASQQTLELEQQQQDGGANNNLNNNAAAAA